jgi:hypothetical protein
LRVAKKRFGPSAEADRASGIFGLAQSVTSIEQTLCENSNRFLTPYRWSTSVSSTPSLSKRLAELGQQQDKSEVSPKFDSL